jgi:hypothetical protein
MAGVWGGGGAPPPPPHPGHHSLWQKEPGSDVTDLEYEAFASATIPCGKRSLAPFASYFS